MVPAGESTCEECGSRVSVGAVEEYEDIEEPEEEEILELETPEDSAGDEDLPEIAEFDPENIDKDLEDLLKLPGVGPLRAKILAEAGYSDLRKLKRASVMELVKIKGIGRKSAGEIKTALRDIDLEVIRSKELDLEHIEEEKSCPLCRTIVSVHESTCYECGTTLKESSEGDEEDKNALSYYDSKLKDDPKNKELWYARGATLIKMEEYEKALSSFDMALEIDENYQNAWISKAEVYNKMNEPMRAAECYSHVISSSSGTDFELEIEPVSFEEPSDVLGESPGNEWEDDEEEDAEVVSSEEPETAEETTEPAEEEPEIIVEEEPLPDEPDIVEEEIVYEEVEEETTVAEPAVEDSPVQEEKVEYVDEDYVPAEGEEVVIEYVEEEEAVEEPEPEPAEADKPEVQEEIVYEEVEEPEPVAVEEPEPAPAPAPEPEPAEDETDPAVLKKSLSIHASAIKPLLLLAKELSIDITEQKKTIAMGVNESKKKNLMGAVEMMRKGRMQIEEAFVSKANDDLAQIANMARELKLDGYKVDNIIDNITEAKKLLDERKFKEAFDMMNKCLGMVENIRSG